MLNDRSQYKRVVVVVVGVVIVASRSGEFFYRGSSSNVIIAMICFEMNSMMMRCHRSRCGTGIGVARFPTNTSSATS